MGSAARSSRMSITFQKNFWGLVVPEPWSSKTSSDEVSPNCAAAAEAPVAARATKRAINAAEVFIFVCIRMVVRLLRLVGSCGGSVGSVERTKKNLQGLVFQTSCAFVATRYDPCSKPLKQYATCFSLFQSTRRGSVLALAVAKTDEISDCRDIRFKYAITSEIDGCIQSRFRVYHFSRRLKNRVCPACSLVRRSQRAEACHDRRSRVFHTANVGSRWRLSESPRSCRCAPERTSPPRRLRRARRVSSSHPNFFPRALEEGSTPKKMPDGAPARSLAPSTRPDRARASRPTLTVPTSPIHELPHRRISRRIPPPRAARVRGRTMTSSTGTPPSSGPLTRPTRAASSSWPST